MAKAMGSIPSFTAIGAKIAAVSNIIEIESMIMPRANQIKTIINKTDSSFMPTELIASIMIVLISDIPPMELFQPRTLLFM